MNERRRTTLRVEVDGSVAHVRLSRPDKLNALSAQAMQELVDAAGELDAQPHVKVAIVSGEGRAFCAGADLTTFGQAAAGVEDGDEAGRREALDLGRRMTDAVARMRALTIAAIHGHCVGGGLVLATACDIRIAADDARFAIPEVDLGIPLTWGAVPRLVREIGPALTKELVLSCRPFTAAEAHEMRLVNRVVAPDELAAQAEELAQRLAAQPAYALRVTKQHVDAVAEEAGSTAHSARDVDTLLAALRDRESLEAMARYLARR